MSNTVTIDVIAEVKRAVDGLDQVNEGLGRVEKKAGSGLPALKGMLAADVISEGVAAIGTAVSEAYAAVAEQEKLGAQTASVLASTGNAARVSADDVTALADAIEAKSMIDAEQVQAGENMLLTFTNVKNAVGEGNDVFTQATQITADMATALGTDMAGQAVQVGKALNDPIAGVSALSRVGVTFTEGQKAQIKAMVDAGDTMGAQKLILGELNKEFGGSAEAAGKTFPGAMKHVKDVIDGVVEGGLKKLTPLLTDAATWLGENLPPAIDQASAAADTLGTNLKPAADAAGALIGWLRDNPETVQAFAITLGILGGVVGIVTAAQWAWNLAMSANPIGLIIIGIAALVAAIVYVATHWDAIRTKVASVVADLGGKVSGFADGVARWFSDGINSIGAQFARVPTMVGSALAGLGAQAAAAGQAIPQGIADGIGWASGALWTAATRLASGVIDKIKSTLGIASPSKVGVDIGANFGDSQGLGLDAAAPGLLSKAGALAAAVALAATPNAVTWSPDITPAITAAGAAAGTGRTEITINVNVSPTADRASIGREIADALDDYYATQGRR